MQRARLLSHLILALLVWGLGAPVMAISCLPTASCAGLGPCPLTGGGEGAAKLPSVESPDCCQRTTREVGPPVLPGAKLEPLAPVALPSAILAVEPPSVARLAPASHGEPPAATVPLYTLHSLLLI